MEYSELSIDCRNKKFPAEGQRRKDAKKRRKAEKRGAQLADRTRKPSSLGEKGQVAILLISSLRLCAFAGNFFAPFFQCDSSKKPLFAQHRSGSLRSMSNPAL